MLIKQRIEHMFYMSTYFKIVNWNDMNIGVLRVRTHKVTDKFVTEQTALDIHHDFGTFCVVQGKRYSDKIFLKIFKNK